jgi:hypothetical protein
MASVCTISAKVLGVAAALLFATSAFASPFPQPKPTGPASLPQVEPLDLGLSSTVTATPARLGHDRASFDLERPASVLTSRGRVLMTRHSRIVGRFAAGANRDYRLECRFDGPAVVNVTVQTSAGTFVQSSRQTVTAGGIIHTVPAHASGRSLVLRLQPDRDVDWTECRLGPA